MKWRFIHIIVLVLCCATLSAQHSSGVRKRTPRQYEDTIRALFRADRWHDAEPFLVAAEREWGGRSNICCLIGRYWYHEGNIPLARRYLLLALVDDSSNTEALEILVRLEEVEGNYATAIVHVNDLLSFSPYNVRLWRKKIELFRMTNKYARTSFTARS